MCSGTARSQTGSEIYQNKCARCHGKAGEGAKAYPHPLVGNRSLAQLTRYIARAMPEDDPGTCTGAEAEKVAAYIFDAFYSPAAQARIKPTTIQLARLTVSEYRYAVADLIGSFQGGGGTKGDDKEHGLRGEYFNSGGKGKRTAAFKRVDPVIRIDFLKDGGDFSKLNTPEIFASWQGSIIAAETGLHEIVVRTEHATRLWLNNMAKPLIDRSVKSGDDTEFRASIYLLAGRAYPVKLEMTRGSIGVRKDPKDKLKTQKTTMALEWKPPHRAAEVIPQRNLIPTAVSASFAPSIPIPPDDRSAGYERGVSVSKEWLQATTDGAIETAAYVSEHLAELSGVKKDAGDRKARLQEFCVKFATRAFRRPLSAEQRKTYVEHQFEQAKDAETAVKRVVLLVLQSPRFLYREPGAEQDAFDVAARMSFGLWDSLPDQELLDAAASGKLKTRDDVLREAGRMLADRRARTKLRGFFLRWLKAEQTPEISRDAKLFPGFDAAAVSDLRTSLELFVEEAMWSDYRQLFRGDHLYLNGRLSKFYGGKLEANAPFEKVAIQSGERAGVLTHPYLLAQFAYAKTSSPIHRGVFLARNVLGVALRQPPDAFTPLAAELHPKLSTRERITLQTSPKDCRSCHGIINPLGFTLEHYDAIGRFRDNEDGKPIDSTGSFVTRSGDKVAFKDVHDLAKFVIGSDEAHEAFVARLFHDTVRQPILAYGPEKLQELQRFFAANGFDVRRLLIEIIAEASARRKS